MNDDIQGLQVKKPRHNVEHVPVKVIQNECSESNCEGFHFRWMNSLVRLCVGFKMDHQRQILQAGVATDERHDIIPLTSTELQVQFERV